MKKVLLILVITVATLILVPTALFLLILQGITGSTYQGQEITISMDTMQVDQYIPFPDGRFAVTNMHDELPPVLIRLDKKGNVVWAVRMNLEIGGTPLTRISEMTLEDRPGNKCLSFFNKSYSEPGYVALTDDYDIDYIHLSPM